jgi:alanine dehydrogenase
MEGACEHHQPLREGVNIYNGYVAHSGVAEPLGRQWRELATVE